MSRWIATGCALVMLAGCLTLPVRGNVDGSDETFSGSATGRLSRTGTLQITSSRGTTCTGNFVYTWRYYGRGAFTCSDGRSGPFEFVSTGLGGTGRGYLNGKPFSFDFGI